MQAAGDEINMEAIPMPASISMGDPLSILEDEPEALTALSMDEPLLRQAHVRNGRPPNPAWQYFIRGAKRNRFHYHAYCRWCVLDAKARSPELSDEAATAHVDATRGVSTDMIKHLKACRHCPANVVTELDEYWAERRKTVSPPVKRKADAPKDKVHLWKATVAAGLPLGWTSAPGVASLVPANCGPIAGVAAVLAKAQLDKVKEGMLNSTVKGGLTLSVNVIDGDVVALSLMNSDGDACALSIARVADWTVSGLETHLRACLSTLRASNLSIVAIVADATLPLAAAARVQAADAPDLLVLPCLLHLLDILAGTVLTEATGVVGVLLEVASALRHPAVRSRVGAAPPVPLAHDVPTFLACIEAIADLETPLRAEPSLVRSPALQRWVADDTSWASVRALHRRLGPLREAYAMSCPTLAHVLRTLARLQQQWTAAGDRDAADLVETFWRWYDLPSTVLACVFHVHLDDVRLAPAVRALAPAYFQLVYSRWFHAPVAAGAVHDIIAAVASKSFPFDKDVTRDYSDVSSFYSFVANSYPELCALCCRLFAVSVVAAPVRRHLRHSPSNDCGELLQRLHIAFATVPAVSVAATGDAHRWLHAHETQAHGLFTQRDWTRFSTRWASSLATEVALAESPPTHSPTVRLRDLFGKAKR
ncbi:hypothetical protein ACHHYP_13630 [Achlya hypogyna]|uniref:BED-type domain-containing protein n=1 Tax=Achlya hypogyna TaxID=1202772 RepID=A0A1V9ZFL7_ACHHY|nr:hypothetical protein ACHHYP_13630 [Achlya hypogyna]